MDPYNRETEDVRIKIHVVKDDQDFRIELMMMMISKNPYVCVCNWVDRDDDEYKNP